MQVAEAATAAEQSEVAWDNIDTDDLAELLQADPEGEDQPELIALNDLEYDLDVVEDNHRYVAEHYADNVTHDKMTAAVKAGNELATKVMDDAHVVNVADARHMILSSESLKDVTGEISVGDAKFDATQVSTSFVAERFDTDLAQVALQAEANNQFKFNTTA